MNYKLIALDIDGTLLNKEKKILPKTKQALIDAQKKGIKVVLSSGRPVPGMLGLSKELELEKYGGYLISYNGGVVYDLKNDKEIYSKSINPSDFQQIYDLSIIHNTNILTYKNNKVYAEFSDDYIEIECRINNMEFVEVDNLLAEIDVCVPKFIFTESGEYLEKIEPLIKSELSDKFSVTRSEPFFLEVMPEGIHKGSSLSRLAEILSIKQSEVMAFGDSYNDMTMIEYAGMGVAMGNAKPEVIEISDYITLSNDDNGIADAIEKLVK